MRPLELGLRNFRSFFGDGHLFDFRDRRLVGIVGPIGAGKSTILDAIAFALYGRTPRVARGTKSLIHQRADQAAVRFRFAVDDDVWEAVRSLRSKGQSQHALYRFPSDDPDAEPVEKILLEGEVNARVEELLGFDYDAFSRSVLLAQGRFAEFLTARPAERDRVLRGLFGHDRIEAMRDIAKARVNAGTHELDILAVRLEASERAAADLERHRAELAAITVRVEALVAAEQEITGLTRQIAETEQRRIDAVRRLDELAQLAERMPAPEAGTAITERAVEARQTRAALAEALEQAHAGLTETEGVLRSAEHAARRETIERGSALLVRLDAAHQSLTAEEERSAAGATRLEKATSELNELAGRAVAAAAAADRSGAAEKQAAAALADAERKLHEAEHADMAATLRAGLTEGDTCPVCSQAVGVLVAGASADVAAAGAAVDEARESPERAGRTARDARDETTAATAAEEAARRRVEEVGKDNQQLETAREAAAATVGEITAELHALLGEGDPAKSLDAARRAEASVQAAVDAARRRVDEARRDLDGAITAEQEADRALGDLRTQLGGVAARLDADADLLDGDPAALTGVDARLRALLAERTDEYSKRRDAAGTEHAEATDRLGARLAELEVEDDFASALASARTTAGMLAGRVAEDEKVVAAADGIQAERAALETSTASFRRLQADLTDARFIRYLLDGERVLLAELGSEHFQRLSSGRYRFSDDGKFAIVDLTAADAVRNADSLSGGETFLASLGLALGLAEMVSRTGGRLEAFFLDEGFGTLDPEHLDLAMEGIEALVADHPDRLVLVVSHVSELRLRIEDLIELDRSAVTGDSVVKSGAGPG